jgi:hypothetical protein
MRVTSREHEAKWQQGWSDLIVPASTFTKQAISVINSLPYKVPFVDPEDFWAYKLEFFRPEGAHDRYDRDRE